MAINFPSATSVGEVYTDASGNTFVCVAVGPPAQWVGSGSSTSLDNTYLRKDASNDPVTGQLGITPATDTTGLVVTQPSGNTAAAMRITNEGSGDSLVIEDSANPDSSPFVITSSGSVGVGTTSPAEQLDVSAAGNILISNKTAALTNAQSLPGSLIFGGKGWNTATGSEDIQGAIGLAGSYAANTGITSPSLTFSVKSSATGSSLTERMRINDAGFVLVGSTDDLITTTGVKLNPTGGESYFVYDTAPNTGQTIGLNRTTDGRHITFQRNNSIVGSISVNSTTTYYATSSDYRLKENVVPLTGAADRLKLIPVRRFNFIADPDTVVDGFLAHEVQDIVPEAIAGEKDAVDADGNPEYQGIDQSKLVPLLTAALQEAVAKIETLEARVAALEGA